MSGDGPERPGLLAAGTQKEVGSLKAVLEKWEERLPGATVLPISALEGINTVDVRRVTRGGGEESDGTACHSTIRQPYRTSCFSLMRSVISILDLDVRQYAINSGRIATPASPS